jgi:hypothetical protein
MSVAARTRFILKEEYANGLSEARALRAFGLGLCSYICVPLEKYLLFVCLGLDGSGRKCEVFLVCWLVSKNNYELVEIDKRVS